MSEKEHAEKRALIAMSGGVDSSVAAALMLKMGYECIGVTTAWMTWRMRGPLPGGWGCGTMFSTSRMIFRRRSLINLFGHMRKAEPQIRASIAIDI